MVEKIWDTKQSKNNLLKHLDSDEKHYKLMYDFYNKDINTDFIRYANEFNGKVKYIQFLKFLINRGEFDLYD